MLSDVIKRLEQEERWEPFLSEFIKMKEDIIADLLVGNITQETVIASKAKLEVLDQIIGIDDYARKRGTEKPTAVS